MKELHCIKQKLIECVECQMHHLDKVNTKELGEVIDMIKDLSEAIYYCTITEAMKSDEEEGVERDDERPSHHHRAVPTVSGDGPAHHDGH